MVCFGFDKLSPPLNQIVICQLPEILQNRHDYTRNDTTLCPFNLTTGFAGWRLSKL